MIVFVLSLLSPLLAFAEPTSRPIDLFPRSIFQDTVASSVSSPFRAETPALDGVDASTILGTFRFDSHGDRRALEEVEMHRLNEDGSLTVGALMNAISTTAIIDRSTLRDRVQNSCFEGDFDIFYRKYVEGVTNLSLAREGLVRILDQESMKRKMEPRVSDQNARFAALSVLGDFAVRREIFKTLGRTELLGTWTARQIEAINAQIENNERMLRFMGRPVTEPVSGAWRGWPIALNSGVMPCGPLQTPAQIVRMPPPSPGQAMCSQVLDLVCPGESAPRAAGQNAQNDFRICGMTPSGLFSFLRDRVANEQFRVPVVIDWSTRVSALKVYWDSVLEERELLAAQVGMQGGAVPPYDPVPITLT